jgi:ribosomal protein L12E/L44/L45/RPP1/RPP2
LKDGFKNLVAITQVTDYTFPLAAKFIDAAKNVVSAPVSALPTTVIVTTVTAPAKEEPKKEEKKEEEEDDFDMGGLFD